MVWNPFVHQKLCWNTGIATAISVSQKRTIDDLPKIDCKSAIHTIQSRSFTFWSVWIFFEFASKLLERVTPWTFFKNLHFLHGSPLKKKKTNRWETFPLRCPFHRCLESVNFFGPPSSHPSMGWEVKSVMLIMPSFSMVFSGATKTKSDSPRWKLGASSIFSHFFGDPALHTTIIPISHVISFPFPCSQTLQQTLKNSPYSNWLVSKSHHGHGPWHK